MIRTQRALSYQPCEAVISGFSVASGPPITFLRRFFPFYHETNGWRHIRNWFRRRPPSTMKAYRELDNSAHKLRSWPSKAKFQENQYQRMVVFTEKTDRLLPWKIIHFFRPNRLNSVSCGFTASAGSGYDIADSFKIDYFAHKFWARLCKSNAK